MPFPLKKPETDNRLKREQHYQSSLHSEVLFPVALLPVELSQVEIEAIVETIISFADDDNNRYVTNVEKVNENTLSPLVEYDVKRTNEHKDGALEMRSSSGNVNRNLFISYGENYHHSKTDVAIKPVARVKHLLHNSLQKVNTSCEFPSWTGGIFNVKISAYTCLEDIQSKFTWNDFKTKYADFVNIYNDHVGNGYYGIRVALHAHNFAYAYLPAAAPTPPLVDGMLSNSVDGTPKWSLSSDRLLRLFSRLVSVTGYNLALVMTSKTPLSMIHAFSSCYFALKLKGAALDAVKLFQKCINWILHNDTNIFRGCSISIQQLEYSPQIVDNDLLYLWCSILFVDETLDIREKLRRMKRYFTDINFLKSSDYSSYLPKMNKLFLCILCIVYKVKITVFDGTLGLIETYTANDKLVKLIGHIVIYKVGESEYFGVFDIEEYVNNL